MGSFSGLAGGGVTYIAVGSVGSTVRVYVGDTTRVQEFEPNGVVKAGGSLATVLGTGAEVYAVAVDPAGNLYVSGSELGVEVVYGVEVVHHGGVYEITPKAVVGKPEELEFTEDRRFDSENAEVPNVVITPVGVIVNDFKENNQHVILYDPFGAELTSSEFFNQAAGFNGSVNGVALDYASGALYVSDSAHQEVYILKTIIGPSTTTGSSSRSAGEETLLGEVNPEGLDAASFFEYGLCAASCVSSPFPNKITAVQAPAGPNPGSSDDGSGPVNVPVEAKIPSLPGPHKYHYRLVGHGTSGDVTGAESSFTVPIKPAVGGQEALFGTSHSIELTGVVNPDYGLTAYKFEYGPCGASCPGSPYPESTTQASAGEGLGDVSVHGNVEGLQPETTYHYRISATNGEGTTPTAESTFTTRPEPVLEPEPETKAPSVTTGTVSAVTAETATISGAVNPNAAPTSYVFELGVYQGAQTQFGSVASGEVGGGAESVAEAYQVANLQAGITYAYRIKATNSQGTSIGQAVTFATSPAPAPFTAPLAPALLATPNIAFPSETGTTTTTTPKALTRAQKLTKALEACTKDKAKSKRAACQKAARKRYGLVGKKKKSECATNAEGRHWLK